ncbi:hypothetical protein [Streptomyces diastatochromogenes]|uniref:hypothetical protein n=1 Tax=Streptomyces diastatochromogenes TaxID=42236 RepID=UPI00117DB7FA|nr:hypothetical protein [Streptomyces diastatochromogenes]MCZ0989380.1 hypothetical protein [Streptomyces diastatochromogenes]
MINSVKRPGIVRSPGETLFLTDLWVPTPLTHSSMWVNTERARIHIHPYVTKTPRMSARKGAYATAHARRPDAGKFRWKYPEHDDFPTVKHNNKEYPLRAHGGVRRGCGMRVAADPPNR